MLTSSSPCFVPVASATTTSACGTRARKSAGLESKLWMCSLGVTSPMTTALSAMHSQDRVSFLVNTSRHQCCRVITAPMAYTSDEAQMFCREGAGRSVPQISAAVCQDCGDAGDFQRVVGYVFAGSVNRIVWCSGVCVCEKVPALSNFQVF